MATNSTPEEIFKFFQRGQKRKPEDESTIYQFFSQSEDPDAKILSNFHVGEKITVTINRKEATANSVEALFQYAKYQYATRTDATIIFYPETILTMAPGDAKSNGGRGGMKKNGYELNKKNIEIWNAASLTIMKTIVAARFAQDKKFKQVLIDTGDKHLLHFSRFDKIWGGLIPKGMDKIVKNINGANKLGEILMELRDSNPNPAPSKSLLDMEWLEYECECGHLFLAGDAAENVVCPSCAFVLVG